MRKNKKIIILISITIFILLVLLTIFILFNKNGVNNKQSNTKKEYIKEELKNINKEKEKTKQEETEVKEEIKVEEEIKKEDAPQKVENNKKTTNNQLNSRNNNQKMNNDNVNNNQNNNDSQAENTTPPSPTYTCPSGYSLNGTECISTEQANFVCTDGTNEFSNGTVSGCVNLNEGYFIEEGSCPAGYGELTIISIGSPNRTKCLPLYSKVPTCADGYNLQGSTCIKKIPATQN